MHSIIVTTILDQNRHIELDLPAEIPTGPVEITIRLTNSSPIDVPDLPRDSARERLHQHGLLSTARYAPLEAVALSTQQRAELGRGKHAPQSLAESIDEDRGPR